MFFIFSLNQIYQLILGRPSRDRMVVSSNLDKSEVYNIM